MTLLFTLALAGDINAGKTLYATSCSACHGATGAGDGAAAAALDPKPVSFTDASFWTDRTDEQLKASIKGGKPGTAMPPFATLTDEQLDDLAAYLRSLQPTD